MNGKRSGETPATEPDDATLQRWVAEATANPPNLHSWIDLTVQLKNLGQLEQARAPNLDEAPGLTTSLAALHCILEFLQEQPVFEGRLEALTPLRRVFYSLADVRDGRSHPMLKPKPRPGKPFRGMAYEERKGYAARAMSELMEGGMAREEAAQKVALALGVTGTEVTSWRNQMMQGEGPGARPNGIALLVFRRPIPAELGATSLSGILCEGSQ